ncbi:MAG: putative zinc-type alcohol dehydrogenase-like protein [Candidatus Uhrbacteria bacterium GW2011_GWF2_39_13]|uniref:Putative zinc-type alcohol dehydrogenase-like protein n=1 Tax=Candidatus Uhrbacteria bacterium GW2011_GWF2_39_13 TaxID=1618995 RepID=A0A0G0MWC7_9BACT|nr:MAG: putative zinc-type alcohol dehydrogenase-like protein [Candidatus Uhrbacteria bacterium GW2011_GWF2_39_13]
MKAAFHTGKKEISIREIDMPEPGENEYLVKIKSCAICGSDIWWPNDAVSNEPVHGHESAGEIVKCGKNAKKFKSGDKVVCYAILGCGKCVHCAKGMLTYCKAKKFVEGGFQEYAAFNESLLFPCPENTDWVTASLLSDAIGVPLRGLRRLPVNENDTVSVWGLGPLGLLQIMFLKANGVKKIIGIDTVNERLESARKLGASDTINPKEKDTVAGLMGLTNSLGTDKAYVYIRHPKVTEDVFKSTRDGASICTFTGLDGKYELQEWYERTLVWSFYFMSSEYEENLKFIKEKNIELKSVVSHVYPLEKINEAFKKRFEEQDKSLKIVINMN